MSKRFISRRDLLKRTAAATAALALGPGCVTTGTAAYFDPKGLPTKPLGKTGVSVPRIGIGAGSRFCSVQDEDEALEILTYALDHGLYYWDTAHDYTRDSVISEERLGKILKSRRKEVFLATKVGAREPDEAKRHIEESLTRLQTDYLDILQLHSVKSVEDVEVIAKEGGVLDVVRKLRDEGVAKNIGFTGHDSAKAMALLAKRYDFNTMLIALNHYKEGQEKFEEQAVPTALEHGLGVMLIKVVRPRETIEEVDPRELVRYALSLKGPAAAVIGTDSLEILKENISILKSFSPMDSQEMDKMRVALAPFFRHEGLEWMRPSYCDGLWA